MNPTRPQSLPKAIAAARKISAFNSQIVIEPQVADLVPANIESLLDGMQLVLDGTDNFETRYLINDFAVKTSLPWIYTAAVGSYGVTLNVLPGKTACLACLFPDPPRGAFETCETAGILNSAVNLAASIAATEAIKLLVGAEPQVRRTLLSFDVCGATNAPKSQPASRGPDAAPAASATLFILPAKAGPTSRFADGTRCRSTSVIGPSISRK